MAQIGHAGPVANAASNGVPAMALDPPVPRPRFLDAPEPLW
ncbi:MAG: hypothetical protein R2699_16755 [Acidimicrobiales bacterium]